MLGLSILPLLLASIGTGYGKPTERAPIAAGDLPRLVLYFQTTHDSSGHPISMLPLVQEQGIALTHLIVCSLHINKDSDIHLNDFPPGDPHFYTLWNETVTMRNSGVKVMGMVGGAAAGSFTKDTLDGDQATFDRYYGQLKAVIQEFGLQGMDLDVEQYMSQAGITRLVNQLRHDFGSDFTITLAPVASALRGGSNLSGFDYSALESSDGDDISFYNAQFYSGFGSMRSPDDFNSITSHGLAASKIVAGQLTSAANGNGYIPYDQLNSTIVQLRSQHGQIGGVMGWEYFNSEPGGTSRPWQWAEIMTQILRPGQARKLQLSTSDVVRLQNAYRDTVRFSQTFQADIEIAQKVNYTALANM